MKTIQIFVYGRIKTGTFCRMIFFIDMDEDIPAQFLRAETKKNVLYADSEMSHNEAVNFINDEKLKLIDVFTTKI